MTFFLTFILLELKVISLCHQYTAHPCSLTRLCAFSWSTSNSHLDASHIDHRSFEKWKVEKFSIFTPPFKEEGVYCFAHVGRLVGPSITVKVTVTFKLRGAYMFHKHFLLNECSFKEN